MIEVAVSKTVEIESTGEEVEVEMIYNVNPGYPCPPCSNPDSPAYSDPGDPGEVEMQSATIDGEDVDIDALEKRFGKKWLECADSEAMEQASSDHDDDDSGWRARRVVGARAARLSRRMRRSLRRRA